MKKLIILLFSFFCIFIFSKIYTTQDEFIKVADNLKFPEGPAYDGLKTLYVSNCYDDWITRITEDKVDTFAVAPTQPDNFQKTNGLVVAKDGSIYACDYGMGAILKFSKDGSCNIFCDGYNGKRFNRPNDLCFDRKGILYFTDPNSYSEDKLDGTIYLIPDDNNTAIPIITGLGFPNGIAFSPDEETLYVSESSLHRVTRFYSDDNKTLKKEVFVELPGGDPDGIAFDIEGNLYVAHFGGGAIYVINSSGKIIQKILTPGKKPSNLEFGDTDMKTLYVTECETNCVYKIRTEIPGMVLFNSPKSE